MLPVYQLSIPTPYPVGPVNVYLIKSDPITLIDIGPDTPEGKKKLREGLKSLGVDLAQIKRVLLTHSHPDHCGLAAWISHESGAAIYAHPHEIRRITGASDHVKERMPLIMQSGLPGDKMAEIEGDTDKLSRPNLDSQKVEPLHGGESLDFASDKLQVIHIPGHAPGHLCFLDSQYGYFFSGDFLLPHITPNPIMEPDPDNPSHRLPVLEQYIAGLQAAEKMDIKLVWPGHGGVFNDYNRVIKEGYAHHQMQFEKIKKALHTQRKSSYQITDIIYPALKGWNIFMGLSEIQAHLDYLFSQGELQGELQDGVMYYWNPEVSG